MMRAVFHTAFVFLLVGAVTNRVPQTPNESILDPRIEAASTLSVKPGKLKPSLRNPNPGPDTAYGKLEPSKDPSTHKLFPESHGHHHGAVKADKTASTKELLTEKDAAALAGAAKATSAIPSSAQQEQADAKLNQEIEEAAKAAFEVADMSGQVLGDHAEEALRPFPALPPLAILGVVKEGPYSLIQQKNSSKKQQFMRPPVFLDLGETETKEADHHKADPCFPPKKCARPQPDPLNPADWRTPQTYTVPEDEQKTEIPFFKNDVSCCGTQEENEDDYLTGPNSRIDSMGVDPAEPQTGLAHGNLTYAAGHYKKKPGCRPCKKDTVSYALPEPKPPKYANPEWASEGSMGATPRLGAGLNSTLKNPIPAVLLEESDPAAPDFDSYGDRSQGDPWNVMYGDENNHMVFSKSEVLPDGTQKMKNPSYTQVNSYDSKIKRTMESHPEFVEKLDDGEAPCVNCAPQKITPPTPACKNCGPTKLGYMTPVYKEPEPAAVPVQVINLELNATTMSEEMCACVCVSKAEAAQASQLIEGICPVCPPCEGKTTAKVKVDCAAQAKSNKRPKCAPVPGESIALNKYRTLQKNLRVIPEVTDEELDPKTPLPTAF